MTNLLKLPIVSHFLFIILKICFTYQPILPPSSLPVTTPTSLLPPPPPTLPPSIPTLLHGFEISGFDYQADYLIHICHLWASFFSTLKYRKFKIYLTDYDGGYLTTYCVTVSECLTLGHFKGKRSLFG